ncbi:hypothetical protein [Demequina litorisediminis]|uniref:hypothetical protein n=1 Tax=Demequina litorisediminis TaxID=1849022 RepID=UPI0024E097BC|nr:hypothetical protein [Demequina litorisediminis]
MESQYLGDILLDGGPGGGAMEAVVTVDGQSLNVRLEIDYPGRLSAAVVRDIDMVFDQFAFVDNLGRETVARGLAQEDSAPARLRRAWEDARGGEGDAEEFLRDLAPQRIVITPDGGSANRDRVVLSYAVAGSRVPGTVTVRFVEPTGPELVPAPSRSFG